MWKKADFALLKSPKLISRKMWVIEKSSNFHTVCYELAKSVRGTPIQVRVSIAMKLSVGVVVALHVRPTFFLHDKEVCSMTFPVLLGSRGFFPSSIKSFFFPSLSL